VQFGLKLTLRPSAMSGADTDALRLHGLGDEDILMLTQVVAYFNYINRIADGLGVPDEPEWGADTAPG
jgi:alkylhydroperoxidase family enzyme